MSLRARVLLALIGLILLTVLGAGLITGGGIMAPFVGELRQSREELANHVARELQRSSDPATRAEELSEDLGVRVVFTHQPPGRGMRREAMRRGKRPARWERSSGPEGGAPVSSITFEDGTAATVVPVSTPQGRAWAVVGHPVDLDRPVRRIFLGLVLLGAVLLLASWAAGRWVLRPIEVASQAMQRVADGELDHRVPAEADVGGEIAPAFNRMARRVEELVQGQRKLMAAVSHELRTPLTRMRLQVELLGDSGADPERVRKLEQDIEAMDGLVEELLESSRLEQGVLALHRAEVDLLDLAAEALGAVDLGERTISLEVEEGLGVEADRTRLLRAVRNLLSNVARYTPPEAEVCVGARGLQAEEVVVWVADDGPGVAEEDLAQLFEPFFRAEASRSRATGGLGLGLMLVRQIAEAHGGRALAGRSEAGGLEVRLVLPRRGI